MRREDYAFLLDVNKTVYLYECIEKSCGSFQVKNTFVSVHCVTELFRIMFFKTYIDIERMLGHVHSVVV